MLIQALQKQIKGEILYYLHITFSNNTNHFLDLESKLKATKELAPIRKYVEEGREEEISSYVSTVKPKLIDYSDTTSSDSYER